MTIVSSNGGRLALEGLGPAFGDSFDADGGTAAVCGPGAGSSKPAVRGASVTETTGAAGAGSLSAFSGRAAAGVDEGRFAVTGASGTTAVTWVAGSSRAEVS